MSSSDFGVGDGEGAGVVGGFGGLVVGVDGLSDVAAGFGACGAGCVASGDGFGLGVGFVVAPGVRGATTGASLLVSGSPAMRSAGAVSARLKVSTVAVAIVAATAVTATLWVVLIRMGVLLAVSTWECVRVSGIGDVRGSAYRGPCRGRKS